MCHENTEDSLENLLPGVTGREKMDALLSMPAEKRRRPDLYALDQTESSVPEVCRLQSRSLMSELRLRAGCRMKKASCFWGSCSGQGHLYLTYVKRIRSGMDRAAGQRNMSGLVELPSLLFRQRLLLAVLAGSASVRDAVFGAGLLALTLLVPGKSVFSRNVLLILFFLLGLGLTHVADPEAPDCPSWASVPGRSVLAEGRIASATGLPGGRMRVQLEELRPLAEFPAVPAERAAAIRSALERKTAASASGTGRKSYPGRIVEDTESSVPGRVTMTLYEGDLESCGRPVPGQTLRGLMRLYPVTGSVNPGTSDLGSYWADHDVWHNARLNRTRTGPVFLELEEGSGAAYRAACLRERWRSALESTLVGDTSAPAAEKSGRWTGESPMPVSQGRAMLVALLFGDRSRLSQKTVDLFTRAGLVHSLALSGQHLALAAMAGSALILLLSLTVRNLFLLAPRRVLVVSAGVPFALLYLFLGGAPFSLIRAACMMLAGALFLCLRRRVAPLDALFAACLLLFIGWRLVAFDLSVQLSVLAVAGILLSLPLISALQKRFPPAGKSHSAIAVSWPRRAMYALIRWTGTMLILSFAAQMAVLPVLVRVFGAVSLNFWMNVLWIPPLTFITLPGAAIGLVFLVLFGAQPLSSLLFSVAAWPADVMLSLLGFFHDNGFLPMIQCFRPSTLSCLGYAVLLAGLMLRLGAGVHGRTAGSAVRRMIVFGLLLMPAGQLPSWVDDIQAARERRVSMTLFDVGQGQSVLLEYPGGRILVDGGGTASPFFDCGRSILAPALTDGRRPRLDAVIVSHTDMDHARGLRWILDHFEVGSLCWSSFSAGDDSADGRALREIARRRNIPERILGRGDVVPLAEGIRLEIVWPEKEPVPPVRPGEKTDGNALSLSLRVVRDGKGLVLLCGDMTASALRRLSESGQSLRSQVLVLPHHGAASGFQRKFYDAVAPEAVMASAAAFNHYGFPSRKVREEMAARKIPLYSTSEQGGMTVIWSDAGVRLP